MAGRRSRGEDCSDSGETKQLRLLKYLSPKMVHWITGQSANKAHWNYWIISRSKIEFLLDLFLDHRTLILLHSYGFK